MRPAWGAKICPMKRKLLKLMDYVWAKSPLSQRVVMKASTGSTKEGSIGKRLLSTQDGMTWLEDVMFENWWEKVQICSWYNLESQQLNVCAKSNRSNLQLQIWRGVIIDAVKFLDLFCIWSRNWQFRLSTGLLEWTIPLISDVATLWQVTRCVLRRFF